jgi:hypothetical protein
MTQDVSRVRIKFFPQTTTPTGTGPAPDPTTTGSDSFACVIAGPTWSGVTRGDVETTCSESGLDVWGNLPRKHRPGKIVDYGTVTFTVEWDIDDQYGGREFATVMDGRVGNLIFYFPPEGSQTTGPTLTINGYCNRFTPAGSVLADDAASKLTAEVVYKINNITPAVGS